MTPGSNTTNAPRLVPAAAALIAIVCASCAGRLDQSAGPVDQSVGQPGGPQVIYSCRGNGAVEIRFFDAKGIAHVTRQGRTIALRKQQRLEEVDIYSDGYDTVRGAGKNVTLQPAGGEPTRCMNTSGTD